MDEKHDAINHKEERQFDNAFFAAICLLAVAILVNGLSNEISHAVMRMLSGQ